MKILDRLPYSTEPRTVVVRGENVRVRPHQIIVKVSISLRSVFSWDPRTPSFPAILDTGNNHNFSIRRGQLVSWAGIQPDALPVQKAIRERQQRIPMHAACFWLHPNTPGKTELSGREPHLLRVENGIAIYPDETGPRLPLLGLRVVTENALHLSIDGHRQRVSLRTPDLWTKLLRWLL